MDKLGSSLVRRILKEMIPLEAGLEELPCAGHLLDVGILLVGSD